MKTRLIVEAPEVLDEFKLFINYYPHMHSELSTYLTMELEYAQQMMSGYMSESPMSIFNKSFRIFENSNIKPHIVEKFHDSMQLWCEDIITRYIQGNECFVERTMGDDIVIYKYSPIIDDTGIKEEY